MKSKFQGEILGFIGVNLLAALISFVTLGIATPWAMCIKYKWETENTIIDGKRLKFVGTGGSLFVNYIKWYILTILTLDIYGFWLYIKLVQWKVENTIFEY